MVKVTSRGFQLIVDNQHYGYFESYHVAQNAQLLMMFCPKFREWMGNLAKKEPNDVIENLVVGVMPMAITPENVSMSRTLH